MKLFKKVLLISSLLLVCIYSITFAANTKFPSVTTNKYINDYTGTISKNYTEKIISIGKELEEKTTAQCVIVVINSTNNVPIEKYANECKLNKDELTHVDGNNRFWYSFANKCFMLCCKVRSVSGIGF